MSDIVARRRSLKGIDAELLFVEGIYVLHSLRGNRHQYKILSAQNLRLAFAEEPLDSGWLPAGIVRYGANSQGAWGVKFIPPQQYRVQLVQKKYSLPLPGLLLSGQQQTYSLWAVKNLEFTPNMRLYQAPLPNIHANGRICWGELTPPIATPQTMEAAWQMFISSAFNSDLSQYKSKAEPEDLLKHLRSLQGNAQYPLDDLEPVPYYNNLDEQIRYLYGCP